MSDVISHVISDSPAMLSEEPTEVLEHSIGMADKSPPLTPTRQVEASEQPRDQSAKEGLPADLESEAVVENEKEKLGIEGPGTLGNEDADGSAVSVDQGAATASHAREQGVLVRTMFRTCLFCLDF